MGVLNEIRYGDEAAVENEIALRIIILCKGERYIGFF